MIRSTKLSLKFANPGKNIAVRNFLSAYRRAVNEFVDILWPMEKIPSLLPKEIARLSTVKIPARALQAAGKQASGIVRACKSKQDKRLYMREKLKKEGKSTVFLEKAIAGFKTSKPKIDGLQMELDSRFVKFKLEKGKTFDGWLIIRPGDKTEIAIPLKLHKHYRGLKGKRLNGCRIGNALTVMFNGEKPLKKNGRKIGLDIGVAEAYSASDGQKAKPCNHGHTLASIMTKLSRCRKGSSGFRRAANHRDNYTGWSINQLNLCGVREVVREDIKDLRRGKRTNRSLGHWTYRSLFDRLERRCEEQGVLVSKVNPAYTSQTCSRCHCRGRRKGKVFDCPRCGRLDADFNASLNIRESIVPYRNVFL